MKSVHFSSQLRLASLTRSVQRQDSRDNSALCVSCDCMKAFSWNSKAGIEEKARLRCPRPDFIITSCFFTSGDGD
ncbi:Hypothetical predicted protein [Xyrichtys novacula]|uniref:Uncharacterized protein n=1 Tax=Xyrichtys novacula TaxID=13765 RepID=A0AAV1HEL7_XYRNO|nr:Hypothetical predicted protein [Xyrichtys novacula]